MGKRRHRHGYDDSIDEEEVDKHKDDKSKKKRRRRHHSESETESESSSCSSSEEEYRRRKRRDKEKKRRKKKEKEEQKKKKKKKGDKEKKRDKGAVTNSWGKFGIIREIDMWNKRPEFSAWLSEVKEAVWLVHLEPISGPSRYCSSNYYVFAKVNLETVPTWEEKQMFKEYMEDYNTATFPSKKYYDLDAYHRRKMIKEMEKGVRKAMQKERTIFNDEDERRQEIRMEREKQKEAEIEAMQLSMQTGMAKAMKEQAQLREEMNYQYRLGNYEAAAAIQKRLDPDAPA